MQNKIEVASPYVKQFNMVKVIKMDGGGSVSGNFRKFEHVGWNLDAVACSSLSKI